MILSFLVKSRSQRSCLLFIIYYCRYCNLPSIKMQITSGIQVKKNAHKKCPKFYSRIQSTWRLMFAFQNYKKIRNCLILFFFYFSKYMQTIWLQIISATTILFTSIIRNFFKISIAVRFQIFRFLKSKDPNIAVTRILSHPEITNFFGTKLFRLKFKLRKFKIPKTKLPKVFKTKFLNCILKLPDSEWHKNTKFFQNLKICLIQSFSLFKILQLYKLTPIFDAAEIPSSSKI